MKKNIFGKQLSIGIVVLFVLGSVLTVNAYDNKIAVSSLGDTLYVGGSGPGNYSTIWEAVINTSNGDTVFVYDYSSPYYEHVTIYNQINLIGENKETTIIDGNGTGNVLSVAADWVTISGFTIQNGVNGIYLDKQSNTTIVSNNGETGIKFSSFSEYNIISENLISNNLNGTSLAAYAYGEITGNSFEDNTGYALILNLWCNENKIHFNNFIGNVNDAKFTTSVMNRWSFNYWDRPHILPKPIFGRIAVFPWVNFDWRPLLTPHELP